MRPANLLYLVLAVASASAAVAIPVALQRGGSAAVSGWQLAAAPGALSGAHAFLSGDCEACHTPFQAGESSGCMQCHASAVQVMSTAATAFHADVQTCRGCHVEHQGVGRRPTGMDHDVLVSIGTDVAGGSWWDRLRAELQRHPGPGEAGPGLDCAVCHADRDPHRGRFGSVCSECHVVESWIVAGYQHPSQRSKDCVQCHEAPPSHYMMHFEMVSKRVAGQEHANVAQCYLCHQTNAWNSIRGRGWYKHH